MATICKWCKCGYEVTYGVGEFCSLWCKRMEHEAFLGEMIRKGLIPRKPKDDIQ